MNIKETATNLSQYFASTFGASYCQISLLPESTDHKRLDGSHRQARSNISYSNQNEWTLAVIPVQKFSLTDQKKHLPESETSFHGAMSANSGTAAHVDVDQDRLSSLDRACRSTRPAIRFDLHNKSHRSHSAAVFGFLFLAFSESQRFAVSELSALLQTVELAASLLALQSAKMQIRSANDQPLSLKPDSNTLALPFLEAKRQWIDAFEREYLIHQLAKHYGNISRVARSAQISRYTVYALLNKFEVSAKSYKRSKAKPKGRQKRLAKIDSLQPNGEADNGSKSSHSSLSIHS